jgi:hypothetical protein
MNWDGFEDESDAAARAVEENGADGRALVLPDPRHRYRPRRAR